MELVIQPYHGLPCELVVFTINGKDADSEDFGDMHFDPKPSTKEVLDKYHITETEYNTICNELEDKLWVGRCGWCI